VCEVFPQTTYANYRKILRSVVDSEVIFRTRAKEDPRRTMYYLSEEMIEPLCKYYMNIWVDFGRLYAEVIDDRGYQV